jgi:DinB superfamily
MTDPRYPIGRFNPSSVPTSDEIQQAIADIRELPERLRGALAGLSEEGLDSPYRPGGWTVRQLVHHLADSHLNAYVRLRLVLTEEAPTIKTYDEKRWAELADARSAPIEPSLRLLEGLHQRWAMLLGTLAEADFARPLRHPEMGSISAGQLTALYGWHCRHHVAHITASPARATA